MNIDAGSNGYFRVIYRNNNTSLIAASCYGRIETIMLLIEKGVSIEEENCKIIIDMILKK